jgi:hypothetical protein
MIPLKEWELSLLRRIEDSNMTTYGIREIDGDYYIKTDDLMSLIDETQDYRDYAEEQIIELNNKLNDMPDVEVNSLQLSTVKALNELHVKYDELESKYKDLEEENKILRNETLRYCNEDDLDRLFLEGVEI